jgi:hypothetical protein
MFVAALIAILDAVCYLPEETEMELLCNLERILYSLDPYIAMEEEPLEVSASTRNFS